MSGSSCRMRARLAPQILGLSTAVTLIQSSFLKDNGEVYFAVSFHTTYDVHLAKVNLTDVFADLL